MEELVLTDELKALIEKTVKDNPKIILAIKPKYLTEELWEYAVASSVGIFSACKKKTYGICTVALAIDGMLLGLIDPIHYTGEQYQNLCDIAVMQNPKAYTLVPDEFRTREMIAYVYSKDPEMMLSEKSLSADTVMSVLKRKPSFIQYVVEPTDEMMIVALDADPRVIVYMNRIPDKVRDFFEERYPEYAAMFIHV